MLSRPACDTNSLISANNQTLTNKTGQEQTRQQGPHKMTSGKNTISEGSGHNIQVPVITKINSGAEEMYSQGGPHWSESDHIGIEDIIWENEQKEGSILAINDTINLNSPTETDYHVNDAQLQIHSDSAGITKGVLEMVSKQVTETRKLSWPRLTPAASSIKELSVYSSCQRAATHNLMGPRIPLHTGLNIDAWYKYSDGNIADDWVLQCIEYGYPMQYYGPALINDIVPNHSSAINFSSHVARYIQKESELGGIIGPFAQPPFHPWCHVAPIMTRPKACGQDRRVIVDLSYPQHNSPNLYIQKNIVFGHPQLHILPTIHDAIRLITSFRFDVVLGSLDIARAYRNFRLDPYDWPLSCIKFQGNYFIDTCMPFGSRLSSLYMQRMSNIISRALARLGVTCLIYLDDALIICPKSRDPVEDYATALRLIRELGLPLAWEKLISPTFSLRFLGVIIDVNRRELSIPKEKCDSFLAFVQDVSKRRWISKRVLQQLIGHINHMAKGVHAARLFMNRLLQVLRSCKKGVCVDDFLLRDLGWFEAFLHQFNGRTLIIDVTPSRVIEADSCLSGGGVLWDRPVIHLCTLKNM